MMSISLVGCSNENSAVADTVGSGASEPGTAVISDSAQDAVSELLGDVDAEVDQEPVEIERIAGVAYEDGDIGVLESSVDHERNLLQVKVQGTEGRRVSMKNGGSIRLRDGLVAEIFVDPFPTHTLTAWVDMYLHDGSGDEYTDVKVQIDYDMYSMGHGPFYTIADKSPNGHYTFRLDYVMFGPWMQLLEVPDPELEDVSYDIEVVIVAVP
jgi:hypothetical protein